ncbi:hypothetical protein HX882_26760 [Pseudomonas gingeri]|uniref:Uncharacterized protein n=1 Tax=Pseudomonas gingeri TaxID=117681 RepID=A0A7Y8C5P6_9PSED|nr:hypothetical protein [Pseudomonas gingeri]NWB99497.1 hypothetical protein [Pseudomonas gingeri]
MAEKTGLDLFFEKLKAPLSTLDTVGLALGVFGGLTAQAARIGLEIKAADTAATQVDNLYAVNGAIPSVVYGTSKDGATGFFRDIAAAAGSYSMGELAGLGTAAILGATTAPAWLVGGAVIVASVGVSVATGRIITALVDTINPDPQAQAQSSGQPVTTAIGDGSIVKTNPDGSWSLSTSTAFYSYDKDGNPLSVVDKVTGNIVSYDSSTGTASALSASTGLSISVQLSADANGQVTAVDPSTGGSLGSWSVNSLGDLQVTVGSTQLILPATGGLSAASVTNFNADGSSNTSTFGSDGSATTVLIDAAGNGIGTVINTPSSVVGGQSTTVFRDGQGNLIGYDTLSAANNGTDSATTLINQYGQDGLFLGTTSSEINTDGSSTVSTKNAIGNLIASDVTAPDGSTVQTTYNSLSDTKLISTISTDANGNVSQTSSTVAGENPGSYVTTTLDASGALVEKETQTNDASGASDYQAYYGDGTLRFTSYIGTDGSRTDTRYEDSSDPKITQSSHFDDNGDLVSQSSTQKFEDDGSYLTTTTNTNGQTLSTIAEQADGSTTQTVYNDLSDTNLKTVIEDDAQGDLVSVSTTTVGTDSDYLTVRQNGDGETTGTDKTTVTYDDQGQKNETIQSFDANGVPTGSQSILGLGTWDQTTNSYDASGDLTRTLQEGDRTVQTDFNDPSNPNLTTVTTFSSFDGSVISVQQTDAGSQPGDYVSTTHDGSGALESVVESKADGSSVETDYDPNNPGSITLTYRGTDGQVTGSQTNVTDTDGTVTITSFDSASVLVAETISQADGAHVDITYPNGDDSQINTTASYGADGALINTQTTVAGDEPFSYHTTTTDADGGVISSQDNSRSGNPYDFDGETDTVVNRNADGAIISETVSTSGAYVEASKTVTTNDLTDGSSLVDTYKGATDDGNPILFSEKTTNGDGSAILTTYDDPSNSALTTTEHYDASGRETAQEVVQAGADGQGNILTSTIYTDPNDQAVQIVVQTASDGTVLSTSQTTLAEGGGYLTTTTDGDGQVTGTELSKQGMYTDDGIFSRATETQSFNANGDLVSTQYDVPGVASFIKQYPDPTDLNVYTTGLIDADGEVHPQSSTAYDAASDSYITTPSNPNDGGDTAYTKITDGTIATTQVFDPDGHLLSTTAVDTSTGAVNASYFDENANLNSSASYANGTTTNVSYPDPSDSKIQNVDVDHGDGSGYSSTTSQGDGFGSYATTAQYYSSASDGPQESVYTNTTADGKSVESVYNADGLVETVTSRDAEGNVTQTSTEKYSLDDGSSFVDANDASAGKYNFGEDLITTVNSSGLLLTTEQDTFDASRDSIGALEDAGGQLINTVEYDNASKLTSYYDENGNLDRTDNGLVNTQYNDPHDSNLTTVTSLMVNDTKVTDTVAGPDVGTYVTTTTDAQTGLVSEVLTAVNGSTMDVDYGSGGQSTISYFNAQGAIEGAPVNNPDINNFAALVGSSLTDSGDLVYEESYLNAGGGDGSDGGDGTDDSSSDPIVLNLSGQDVTTSSLGSSKASFDMLNNGGTEHTAWVTAGEGLLVFNEKATGVVSSDSDLVQGFGALKLLDSNQDGVLNASDAAWEQLKVWVDTTGSAQFDSGSLYSLDQLGITSIKLGATAVSLDSNGNTILDQSSYTKNDGTHGVIDGVSLVFNANNTASTTAQADQLVSAMAAYNAQSQASVLSANEDPLHGQPILVAAHA